MDFNNLKGILIDNLGNLLDKLKQEDLDKYNFLYNCPYCESGINESYGYRTCNYCKNNYRIYKNNIYKDEETINDILFYFIKIITHISNSNNNISDKKLDYIYYIVKEEIKLSNNQIKWCAIIFKETETEIYTSELIEKFKNSLKKYYCDNYNIERLNMLRWIINLINIDLDLFEKQEKILSDYIRIFNIKDSDYAYINYSEVSVSRD
ncbi:hypothetical protein [Paraclostridium sordellii]|uniref:hypothetical protein n=1 Tax=Paraclostridium sordellii TaxID=1505 RepID=UPI0005DC44EB|nr:hypothetical protein [Paeniclostridium sordellii]CEO09648.1 Uncharacterised protein [[Clostridium] sordellii] [Paeniclostridium sordellii]CEP87605.1 Uncharacterised protein [[Clostridium] sordellii] [Paeniclostridium sordellii]CEP95941.1 Uncharacterised protein [[Clostridium] sordellii] [Paeniclostridium sordellii]CEP98715.1 Uncharacterised protein [[Clostridium] sordellii] [Paeniclostridium sordellii]